MSAGDLVRAHPRFVEAAIERGEAVRSLVVASWSRSARLHGLDPARPVKPARLEQAELSIKRERSGGLLRAARPSLDRLFKTLGQSGCCVLLADSDGVPLERRGAPPDDPVFADWGLWPGTFWCEAEQGTNGIGTCLVEERPVTIHRDQHFLARNTQLSCMSAPIFNAAGRLLGVIDVSSARSDLNDAMTGLIGNAVAEAARRIEAEVFRETFPRARIVLLGGAEPPTGALLAVDEDGLVIGATRGARTQLRLPDDLRRQPVPLDDLMGAEAPDNLEEAYRAVLRRALARAGGNASAAARALGISRATFHRKLSRRQE